MPENTATPSSPAASSSSAASAPSAGTSSRPAAEVYKTFMAMTAAAVEATGSSGWRYQDGSAWDPAGPDLVFHPQRCTDNTDGHDARDLQLELEAPAPADAREARDAMRTYLEGSGFTLRSVIDAPEGGDSNLPYTVAAAGQDGELIVYSANRLGEFLSLESECSDHPSLEQDVGAETR